MAKVFIESITVRLNCLHRVVKFSKLPLARRVPLTTDVKKFIALGSSRRRDRLHLMGTALMSPLYCLCNLLEYNILVFYSRSEYNTDT